MRRDSPSRSRGKNQKEKGDSEIWSICGVLDEPQPRIFEICWVIKELQSIGNFFFFFSSLFPGYGFVNLRLK